MHFHKRYDPILKNSMCNTGKLLLVKTGKLVMSDLPTNTLEPQEN